MASEIFEFKATSKLEKEVAFDPRKEVTFAIEFKATAKYPRKEVAFVATVAEFEATARFGKEVAFAIEFEATAKYPRKEVAFLAAVAESEATSKVLFWGLATSQELVLKC